MLRAAELFQLAGVDHPASRALLGIIVTIPGVILIGCMSYLTLERIGMQLGHLIRKAHRLRFRAKTPRWTAVLSQRERINGP